MAGFSFGNINVQSKKHILGLETIDDCIAYDCSRQGSRQQVNVLLDEYLEGRDLEAVCRFLKANGLDSFRLMYSLNCKAGKEEIERSQREGVIGFYTNNRSGFESKLIPYAPVITFGPALYSLLQENDIQPNHVQQRIFGKPSFWFSKDLTQRNCHRVFPLEPSRDIFADGFENGPVDSFRTVLAKEQISDCIRSDRLSMPDYRPLNKVFIEDGQDFMDRFYTPNAYRIGCPVAWDLETSGFSFLKDTIGCITLSFDGETGYYIPWRVLDDGRKALLDGLLDRNVQIGANLKFDVKFLWANGLPHARIDEDIIILGHCLCEKRSNSLKSLAFYYSEYGGYERELDAYKKKTRVSNYLRIDEATLREYAVMDAIVTRRAWANMMDHTRRLDRAYPNECYPANGLERYYYDRCIPATNMYAHMEYRGFYVSKDRLDALRVEMSSYIKDCKRKLSEAFHQPMDFDWNSGVRLGTLLEAEGWEDLGRSKLTKPNVPKDKRHLEENRVYLTSDFQLKRWEKDHPVEVGLIKDLKHAQTLLNSFVGGDIPGQVNQSRVASSDFRFSAQEAYDDEVSTDEKGWAQYMTYHPEDGSWRMHANYQSMGTDSGRTKCQRPNLQNTPTRGMFASDIKKCVCTPDDDRYYLVTLDYSSLQMRLAAIDQYPPDKNLYDAFWTPNIDMHSHTAYLSFCSEKGFNVEKVSVEQDGKTYEFLGGELVLTQNRGEVFARDLEETDTLAV